MNYIVSECKALDEKAYIYTHESGLKIYIVPKKGFKRKCAYFAANYGSMDVFYEKDGKKIPIPDGLAHFLEHKLFESEEGDAFTKYAKTGASANAFTSFGCTAYNFSCADKFYENLEILTDLVQTPYFTDENVKKEQGIIGQEINMYLDAPDWRVYQNMLEAMYQNSTVRRDIAGSVQSISTITPELLYDCYSKFYAPENMVLVLVGDIEHQECAQVLERLLCNLKKRECPKKVYLEEPENVGKSYTEQKLSVSFPIYMIGFKSKPSTNGIDTLRQGITGEIALGILYGKSSKFFTENYEKGYINDKFGAVYEICNNYSHAILECDGKYYMEVKKSAVETAQEVAENGISNHDFERRKTLLKSDFIRGFNDVEKIAGRFMDAEFDKYNSYDTISLIDDVTKEEVLDFIKGVLVEENSVLSVILPK